MVHALGSSATSPPPPAASIPTSEDSTRHHPCGSAPQQASNCCRWLCAPAHAQHGMLRPASMVGMPVPVACGAAPASQQTRSQPSRATDPEGIYSCSTSTTALGAVFSVRQIPCTLLLLCRTKHEHLSRFRRAEGWYGACCSTALLASRKPPEPP